MSIDVILDRAAVPIDEEVFTTLLDNSVAGTYKGYDDALESRRIKFDTLVFLARKGDIPYSLFFAPLSHVREQVDKKTKKLLAGVSKETFSIGSRAKMELRDVELIVKDLIRKQQLLKKHDATLERNRIVGLLRKTSASVDDDASRLMSTIGLSHEMMRTCKTKSNALGLMIECLEASQVLVAQSVQHHMPQKLSHVKFSGMSIRDNKIPYIFLAGGDHGDFQETTGRTIFTLALMTVLVACKIFAPMTWDGGSAETELGREYDIAGAMLMPATQMKSMHPVSLEDMKAASSEFHVTASAVTVRAMRLKMITGETASVYLSELRAEFGRIPKDGPRNQILPENAVRKYSGRELTQRMLRALDSMSITPGEFCRTVCLNRLKPSQIDDLRRAVG